MLSTSKRIAPGVIALALTSVGAPRAAVAQGIDHFALRTEVGVGAMLSPYQRNTDPSRYGGSTPGYDLATTLTARLALNVSPSVALQASVTNWLFAGANNNIGWLFAPLVGLRVEPRIARGKLFVDANLGVGFTGTVTRMQFDLGVGYEFDLGRYVALGPSLRYGQTVQPESVAGRAEPWPEDARYLAVALSFTLRTNPTRRLGTPAFHAVRAPTPAPPRPRDSDGDGAVDPEDLCPTIPSGTLPDRLRHGCPETDVDGDAVTDREDRCPTVASGPHPDPSHRGCPDPDDDNDGVTNSNDACPETHFGATENPARGGCPDPDRDNDGLSDSRDRCPEAPETFDGLSDEDGCPEPDAHSLVDLSNGVIRLSGAPVEFAPRSARLVGRSSFNVLDSLAHALSAHAEIALVEVQGHTDDRGRRSDNLALSLLRANAVREYLIDHGIAPERVTARGLGPDRPLASNRTSRGRALNRRVEVHILRWVSGAGSNTPPSEPAHP